MKNKVLVLNPGSSSFKISVFDLNKNQMQINCKLVYQQKNQHYIIFEDQKIYLDDQHQNHIALFLEFLKQQKVINDINEIHSFVIRSVFNNLVFDAKILDEQLYDDLKQTLYLSPIHNQYTIDLIDEIKKHNKQNNIILVSDSWFHTTINDEYKTIAINQEVAKKYNIVKKGFHGISCSYIVDRLKEITNKKNVNLIIAHLGNGSSITNIYNSQSINTTMSYTPLSGIIMNSRCGDIDPSILLTLKKEYSNENLNQLILRLYQQSGVYGISNNKSINLEDTSYNNQIAVKMFVNSVVNTIVNYMNDNPNLDGIVFSGTISLFESKLIKMIIDKIKLVKLQYHQDFDKFKNDDYYLISTNNSSIKIYILKTNEELVMYKSALKIIKEGV